MNILCLSVTREVGPRLLHVIIAACVCRNALLELASCGRREGVVFLQSAGDVQSWFVSGSTLGINPPDLSYGTREDEPISGTLLNFTDTVVEGQIRGLVTILRVTNTGSEERLANFSTQFRITASPDFAPLTGCFVQ